MGFVGDDFYNMAVGFDTEDTLEELRSKLRRIEDAHGRRRDQKKLASRTLDIDLLTYGELVEHTDQLDLPRREIAMYAFVLLPLSEIAPDLIHPELGKSMRSLWREFDAEAQPVSRVDFDFGLDQGTADLPPSTGTT